MNQLLTVLFSGLLLFTTTVQVGASNSSSCSTTAESSFATISESQLFDESAKDNVQSLRGIFLQKMKDLRQIDSDLQDRKTTMAFFMSEKILIRQNRHRLLQQHGQITELEDLFETLKAEIYQLKNRIEFLSKDEESIDEADQEVSQINNPLYLDELSKDDESNFF